MRKILISAVLLLPGGLFAQQRPSVAAQDWWRNPITLKNLDLSEAQAKQLSQIQQSYVTRLMDLRAAVNKANGTLEEVFAQANPDELKAETAVDQYANALDNMTRELTRMSLKMRAVLTDEQWQQLVATRNGRGGRGGGGRGRRGPPQNNNNGTTANKVGPAISQK